MHNAWYWYLLLYRILTGQADNYLCNFETKQKEKHYLIVCQRVTPLLVAVMLIVCFVSTTVFYVKIYLAVRRHRNQIQALQLVLSGEHMPNVARLRKSAVGPFYVYLVFLVCFLPQYCIFVTILISGPSTTVEDLLLLSWTLMFLSSTLIPLIYCWKMKHIRRVIMHILRNAFSSHN